MSFVYGGAKQLIIPIFAPSIIFPSFQIIWPGFQLPSCSPRRCSDFSGMIRSRGIDLRPLKRFSPITPSLSMRPPVGLSVFFLQALCPTCTNPSVYEKFYITVSFIGPIPLGGRFMTSPPQIGSPCLWSSMAVRDEAFSVMNGAVFFRGIPPCEISFQKAVGGASISMISPAHIPYRWA